MKEVSLNPADDRREIISGTSLSRSLQLLIKDGVDAWNISTGMLMVILSLPFFVLLFGVITGLIGKDAYKWLTGEDRVAENMQVLLWIVSFVLSLRIVQKKAREGDYLFAILYGVLSVGIFFIIGEEVSWGQRIFGWATPESMKVINKQDETNIHNIHGIGSTIKWLHLVLGAYGTFLPLFVIRVKVLQRFRNKVSMLVPHYTLIPFFCVPFVWRIYRNFFEAPKRYYFAISEFSEIIEVIIALAFMFFLVFQLKQIQLLKAGSGKYNNRT